ncbi:MAG: DUF2007 domain-containing protein [Coriobacteriia bacterium]|nr:DUF2007 domain-containing protein [Coriobacteriia bacterium]
MYCPRCESEYQPGFFECAECGTPLVDELTPSSPYTPLRLETVFAAGRPNLVAIAKSVLVSADVEFVVRGEHLQEMFSLGRFPYGYNVFIGPIELLVSADDAVDARALLADIGSSESSIYAGELSSEDVVIVSPIQRRVRALSRLIVMMVLLYWALGFGAGLISLIYSALFGN